MTMHAYVALHSWPLADPAFCDQIGSENKNLKTKNKNKKNFVL